MLEKDARGGTVALLAEGVDRNRNQNVTQPTLVEVALLAEGVDRNKTTRTHSWHWAVALLAEGVDRNTVCLVVTVCR